MSTTFTTHTALHSTEVRFKPQSLLHACL